VDLNIELLPWQRKVWEDPARFHVVAAGRRSGKTRLAIWRLLVNALETQRGHVFYVAPTQGQAKDVIWDDLLDLGRSVVKKAHINDAQITLINGSKISLKGADRPETMRGVSLKYLVMDEYADMKPDVWELILRPALADQQGRAMFIGTPMGRNHFYDLYKYAELQDDPDWAAWHLTSYDNPMLARTELEAAKKSMSSYAFRQEFMASFEAKGSEFFKEEFIEFYDDNETHGDTYIAVDLAGFEEVGVRKKNKRLDQTAIAVVDVSPEGWYVKDIQYGRWDLNATAQKIFEAVRIHRPVAVGIEKGIAKQAVMSPLTDMMRQRSFFFNVQELTHGNKKKTDRILWALQGRYENRRIKFKKASWNTQLMDQLFQFPDSLTHDDLIDALAYIDQLAVVAYRADLEIQDEEILDIVAGY
jgi:predicted phage terminase large subunit-like protein